MIELLVVIAIIGILSSVAVVNLNSAREKAKIAAAEHSFSALVPAIVICYSEAKELSSPNNYCTPGPCLCTTDNAVPIAGEPICEGSNALWPKIDEYNLDYLECDSDPLNNTWQIRAGNSDGEISLICAHVGCQIF